MKPPPPSVSSVSPPKPGNALTPARVILFPVPYSLLPIPCSLTNLSQKKTPNLRPQTPQSPAIRDDFNFVDDVLAAILIKSGQLQVSSAGKTGQLQSTTFSETGNL